MTLKISKKELLIILLTLPVLKPDYMNRVFWCDLLFNALRIVVFIFLVVFGIYEKRRIIFPTFIVILMEIYVLINTVILDGDVSSCLKTSFPVVSIILIYDFFSDDLDTFVRAELFCYEILIYMNFMTIIAFPKGLYFTVSYKNWFLGYYNSHIQYFLPAIIFSLLYTGEDCIFRRGMIITATVCSAIKTWSGGSIVAIFAILVGYFIMMKKTQLFNYFSYWLIQPMFFVLVVINQKADYIKWIVGDILGKWNSLKGRMLIWSIECANIKDHFIFGNGVEFYFKRVKRYLHMPWAVHSHNFILEMLHQGGLIYLVLFLVLVVVVGRKILPFSKKRFIRVVSLIFLGWAIRGTVDPCLHVTWIAFFVLAYKSVKYFDFELADENRKDYIIGEKGGNSRILC